MSRPDNVSADSFDPNNPLTWDPVKKAHASPEEPITTEGLSTDLAASAQRREEVEARLKSFDNDIRKMTDEFQKKLNGKHTSFDLMALQSSIAAYRTMKKDVETQLALLNQREALQAKLKEALDQVEARRAEKQAAAEEKAALQAQLKAALDVAVYRAESVNTDTTPSPASMTPQESASWAANGNMQPPPPTPAELTGEDLSAYSAESRRSVWVSALASVRAASDAKANADAKELRTAVAAWLAMRPGQPRPERWSESRAVFRPEYFCWRGVSQIPDVVTFSLVGELTRLGYVVHRSLTLFEVHDEALLRLA